MHCFQKMWVSMVWSNHGETFLLCAAYLTVKPVAGVWELWQFAVASLATLCQKQQITRLL